MCQFEDDVIERDDIMLSPGLNEISGYFTLSQ